MIGKFCIIVILCLPYCAYSQYKVQFVIDDKAMHKASKIYAAGSFNNWAPNNERFVFTKQLNDTHLLTTYNLSKGLHQFKFTQGSWITVEDSTNGVDKQNRLVNISSDTTLFYSTLGWHTAQKVNKHTSSAQVHILTDSFYMPELKRYRRIALYLPANYYASNIKYPVLYMQDGQNLFDKYTAPYGEWGIDETLDTLQQQTRNYAIIVAIDHAENKRINEYNPFFSKEFGLGIGNDYIKFLVNTLKPFIDKHYKTKPEAKYTAIAGSSMGGLISTYAFAKYPATFGTAGIFSPAYWLAPQLYKTIDSFKNIRTKRYLWFYGGAKEGYSMMPDMIRIKTKFIANKNNIVQLNIDDEGLHNEATWRKWFPIFYQYWFSYL